MYDRSYKYDTLGRKLITAIQNGKQFFSAKDINVFLGLGGPKDDDSYATNVICYIRDYPEVFGDTIMYKSPGQAYILESVSTAINLEGVGNLVIRIEEQLRHLSNEMSSAAQNEPNLIKKAVLVQKSITIVAVAALIKTVMG